MIDPQGQRVLFVCEFGPPFTGRDFRQAGVGGTESCVILLAEEYARRGAAVTVANRVAAPVVDGGVRYVPLPEIGGGDFDPIVLWKVWSDAAAGRRGLRVFLWTDVHMPDPAMLRRCREWATVTLTLSEYQRRRLARATGAAALVALGCAPVEIADYPSLPREKERLLLYCSVPDRGLYYLKDLFPRIRREAPGARLAITSDFSLWGAQPAKEAFLKFFAGQEGVEYAGHVSRRDLVSWQQRARVMAYPCRFEEGFCLSAAECMAAGGVPVTTNRYALVSTVADGGILVNGHPRGWLYRRRFVRACVRLLTDDRAWADLAERGRARTLREYSPARTLDRVLAGIAEGGAA
jgi:hypothetical protein